MEKYAYLVIGSTIVSAVAMIVIAIFAVISHRFIKTVNQTNEQL